MANEAAVASRSAGESSVGKLAQFFPEAVQVRIPVRVTGLRRNGDANSPHALSEQTVIEYGTPEEVLFATKPQLAGALLEGAHRLGIRAAFVAGDEVYGGRELRRGIRRRGMGYVMAVRANHALTVGSGRTVTAAAAAGMIPARAWQRMRAGSGTKGTRHYDWAMLEVTSDDTPTGDAGGHSVLLVRRHRYTGTLSFYRCWTPGPVPLARLIAIAVARWR